ncbi:unnamed protein product [Pocillopora meandrina]|uniref:Uncharacterized protein n=1 Tax=Pocillopora meandrina TaxID=46732 RepID=A0AAU9WMG6_9CNID|nr:unnamed protein product [Pocillopora meandrina]
MPHSFRKCTLLTIEGIENLVSYLNISCLQIGNKRNQTQHMKRKQKSLTETPEEKENQLIARHEYEK